MASFDAFFLPAQDCNGQRYGLFHRPAGTWQGAVLYVHPFTEEMNKSRRMAASQARTLAEAGFGVLQIDLLGCGDSTGDFEDATWQAWLQDVLQGCAWLRAQSPDAPLWLWGLRAGCLLAVEAARHLPTPCHFMLWAPPAAGKTLLQQFLRLKAAAGMLEGNTKGFTEGLRQQLAAGTAVEIAGYTLSPGLAHGMEAATLTPPEGAAWRAGPHYLEWMELSTRTDAGLSPVAQKTLEQWRQHGFRVRSHSVVGPSFWQTTEIEDAPALLSATVQAMAARQTTDHDMAVA